MRLVFSVNSIEFVLIYSRLTRARAYVPPKNHMSICVVIFVIGSVQYSLGCSCGGYLFTLSTYTRNIISFFFSVFFLSSMVRTYNVVSHAHFGVLVGVFAFLFSFLSG